MELLIYIFFLLSAVVRACGRLIPGVIVVAMGCAGALYLIGQEKYSAYMADGRLQIRKAFSTSGLPIKYILNHRKYQCNNYLSY